jgi:hypothetical protein
MPSYKQMLSSSPKSRLNPQKFLESEYFENEYVETCLFLETIALKEAHEKDKFFKYLFLFSINSNAHGQVLRKIYRRVSPTNVQIQNPSTTRSCSRLRLWYFFPPKLRK